MYAQIKKFSWKKFVHKYECTYGDAFSAILYSATFNEKYHVTPREA